MFPLLLIAAAVGSWFLFTKKETAALPPTPKKNGAVATQPTFPTSPLPVTQQRMSFRNAPVPTRAPPPPPESEEPQTQQGPDISTSASSSGPVATPLATNTAVTSQPTVPTAAAVITQTAATQAVQAQTAATQAATSAAVSPLVASQPSSPMLDLLNISPPPEKPVARGPGATPGSAVTAPTPKPVQAVTIAQLQRQMGNLIVKQPKAPPTTKPIPGNARFQRKDE